MFVELRKVFLALVVLCMSIYAKDWILDIKFSEDNIIHGKVHDFSKESPIQGGYDSLFVMRDKLDKPVVCRLSNPTPDEKFTAIDVFHESSKALRVTYVEGYGKVFLFLSDEMGNLVRIDPKTQKRIENGELRRRGIAYVIYSNGTWEKGIWCQRTLGWKSNDIWGGYDFVLDKNNPILPLPEQDVY